MSWTLLGWVGCLLGCGGDGTGPRLPPVEVRAADLGSPVALRLANAYELHDLGAGGSCPCTYHTGMSGIIEVDNLGYGKDVAVRLQDITGSGWREVSARYAGPGPVPGKELFVFETPRILTGYYTGSFQFAIRYTVGGATYWDNHGGWNYEVQGPSYRGDREAVLGTAPVGLGYAYFFRGSFSGGVLVQDLASDKKVSIVYSLDGWKTTQVAAARYDHPGIPGQQWWSFGDPVPSGTTAVDFAVSYQVAGTTHWDNNLGANYHLDQSGAATYQFPR